MTDAQRRERVAFEIGAYEAFNHVLNWLNTLEEQVVDKGKIYKAVANLRPDLVHFAFPIRNLHPEGDGMTEDEAPEIGSHP